jgi:glycosyltransferase involved in cell wall biosynthesis
VTPIRVLELRSVRGTGGGPEKTILMGAARSDGARFAVTVCYIRDTRDDVFRLEERARALGIDYVEVRERHSLDRAIWPALRRLVREREIDIVHAHDYKTDLLGWLMARAEAIVPLATVHGWTGRSARETLIYYPADKRILRAYPRLIAVSGQIRAELIRVGASPGRVITILNGIDPEVFRRDRSRVPEVRGARNIPYGRAVVGAVGRLEPQKRFDLLIQAFAIVHRKRPETMLLIIGDGSERSRLEMLAARLGVDAACCFLGHRDDIIDLHHAFDLLVQSSDYEGTPNAVLEAMALETPIVATDVGGTRELVEDGVHALLTPAGHAEAIAEAIEATLCDAGMTAQRVVAARRRVEGKLSFEARQRALEAVYLDLAAEHQRRSA